MTVNELLGKIEVRIKELGKLKMDELRREHPEVAEGNGEGMAYGNKSCKTMTAGMTREDIIAEIIIDEFSLEFDVEIDN